MPRHFLQSSVSFRESAIEMLHDNRIPDPDNPVQPRQIDVAIRREDSLTIVECRLHKDPQDVTWIEELMGRRISLSADAVIAVSASGFTKTAREKATHYGIILRDFSNLSREEVQNWGRKWKLTINYCEFTDVTCLIQIDGLPPPLAPTITDLDSGPLSPLMWRMLIQDIMRKLDQNKWLGLPSTIESLISAPMLVNGKPPASIHFKAKVRRVTEKVELASVVMYADPVSAKNHAAVAKYQLGVTEIIENCDDASMIFDLSQLKIPERCCFETASLDAGRVVNMHISSFVGGENVVNCAIPINILLGYTRNGKAA
jgi:hypothetical protein